MVENALEEVHSENKNLQLSNTFFLSLKHCVDKGKAPMEFDAVQSHSTGI